MNHDEIMKCTFWPSMLPDPK